MFTPCIRMELSSDTCISATTAILDMSASCRLRAKYSTRSELVKLTTGALTINADTGCASTSCRKPEGRSTVCSPPPGFEEAMTRPWPSSRATELTRKFCRAVSYSMRLALRASIHSAMEFDSPSIESVLASSTSTPSRVRFSAACAPATKRVA